MKPADWIQWYSKDGTRNITYDKAITTKEQATAKGYTDVKNVYEASHLKVSDSEQYYFKENGIISNGNGGEANIANGQMTTSNGVSISYAKTGMDQLLEVGGVVGDAITVVGFVTLQPELVVAGGYISNGALAGNVANSFYNEGVNEETITKNGTKVAIGLATNGLGNTAVKATRTVAGKQFVESGANAVSESVAQGVVGAGGKVAEKIADDKQK